MTKRHSHKQALNFSHLTLHTPIINNKLKNAYKLELTTCNVSHNRIVLMPLKKKEMNHHNVYVFKWTTLKSIRHEINCITKHRALL